MTKNTLNSAFFLATFLLLFFAADAQELLHVKKKQTAKMTTIELYDVVKIKAKNGEEMKGQVSKITPQTILVNGYEFGFEEIEYIRTYHMFWRSLGKSLEYGGVMFGGVFLINGLITGASPLIAQGALIAVGSLIIAGIIIESASMQTYRLSKGWTLEPIIIPTE